MTYSAANTHHMGYADCTVGKTWVVRLHHNHCQVILYFLVDCNSKLSWSGHLLHMYGNTVKSQANITIMCRNVLVRKQEIPYSGNLL